MPIIKVTQTDIGNNKGSCKQLTDYLEKENEKKQEHEKEYFFSHDREQVKAPEVIDHIDNNRKGLKINDAKFYLVNIAPSQDELKHIGNDREKLREYTRAVMEKYAEGFGKGLQSADLVWYAKIEQNRTYTGLDKEVQQGKATQGDLKPHLNTHIHVIVSRKDKSQKYQLSPLTNHRATDRGAVKGGFDRCQFKEAGEQIFDKMFRYDRRLEETFEYSRTMKKGTEQEKKQMVEKRLAEGYERTLHQEPQKGAKQEKGISKQQEKGIEKDIQPKKDQGLGWGMGFGM